MKNFPSLSMAISIIYNLSATTPGFFLLKEVRCRCVVINGLHSVATVSKFKRYGNGFHRLTISDREQQQAYV